jgi:catechol 2,3-dioxygenase
VLGTRAGPRLHHFAYITERENLLRAGDAARSLGYRESVEYGPSRHGQDHNNFLYFRDPDGHRFELTSHPIQIMDLDSLPICREVTERDLFVPWGQPAPQSWHDEASEFAGEPVSPPLLQRTW